MDFDAVDISKFDDQLEDFVGLQGLSDLTYTEVVKNKP